MDEKIKKWVKPALYGLAALFAFGIAVAALTPESNGESGYLCCAFALDTSRLGFPFVVVGSLIGIVAAGFMCYKMWEGRQKIRNEEAQRALRWVDNFSGELISTVTSPEDKPEKLRFLSSKHVAQIIELHGKFLRAAQSGEEETVEQVKSQLEKARNNLEREGWAVEDPEQYLTVYVLYDGERERPRPPSIGSWRATGQYFDSMEKVKEFCSNLFEQNSSIGSVMVFDILYGRPTHDYDRKSFLEERQKH